MTCLLHTIADALLFRGLYKTQVCQLNSLYMVSSHHVAFTGVSHVTSKAKAMHI